MDQESYQIGFEDALLAWEAAIEEHMAWHVSSTENMADFLQRRIRELREARFTRR
jgi:hypothetical protein